VSDDTTSVQVEDDVQLCVQTLGAARDPALLLLGGATWSMDWWEDELCDRLVRRGRRVVRYDQRDTGRSTSWPRGAPGYGGAQLTSDAVAVLDALGIERAHVVGLSMGAGVAQCLALEHPGRLATLTLVAGSPIGPRDDALPGPTRELQATFTAERPDPDWGDREAVVDFIVEGERPYAGPDAFDELRLREIAGRVVDRTRDIAASLTNHELLEGDGPADARLSRIAVPTLVLHGTADPLFPLAHGRALAAAIPGARLVELEGVGHQLPPPRTWDLVVDALIDHTEEAVTR
jgi:pimeloyl-ACP methyl ester carboxylesterase